MVLTVEIIVALFIFIFFAVEGFSGPMALNVLLMLAGITALSLAGLGFWRAGRAPR